MKKNMMEFGLTPQLPYSVEEAINRLRINISFFGSDIRKIMIISSEPNEGKSFLAMNIWNQMAESGEKVVLLDADMRNSRICKTYKMKREDGEEMKGTSHFLSGKAEIDDVVLHTKYGDGDLIPNVENVINPSLLLESDRFISLLEALEEHYKYVFVDAPPLGLVSDAEKIGSLCDGAILCVRSGVTSKRAVRDSVRQLERAGCPLLGIVLNRVDESKRGYGYGYGRYGRYGYGRYGYGRYGGKYYGGKFYGGYYGEHKSK
jgi:capsular exopolysaccharide synthesis family protein